MNASRHENMGAPLRLVAEANASIRTIIVMSRQVNLVAINAGLVAKRAGAQARGFSVVSAELRRFSDWLDCQMEELDALIGTLVMSLADVAKERHRQQHLHGAHQLAPGSHYMDAALARVVERLNQADAANQGRWDELQRRLKLILRECRAGTAFARSAKVEAVYGGSFAGGLRQVAEEIEGTIGAIHETLALLSRHVAAAKL